MTDSPILLLKRRVNAIFNAPAATGSAGKTVEQRLGSLAWVEGERDTDFLPPLIIPTTEVVIPRSLPGAGGVILREAEVPRIGPVQVRKELLSPQRRQRDPAITGTSRIPRQSQPAVKFADEEEAQGFRDIRRARAQALAEHEKHVPRTLQPPRAQPRPTGTLGGLFTIPPPGQRVSPTIRRREPSPVAEKAVVRLPPELSELFKKRLRQKNIRIPNLPISNEIDIPDKETLPMLPSELPTRIFDALSEEYKKKTTQIRDILQIIINTDDLLEREIVKRRLPTDKNRRLVILLRELRTELNFLRSTGGMFMFYLTPAQISNFKRIYLGVDLTQTNVDTILQNINETLAEMATLGLNSGQFAPFQAGNQVEVRRGRIQELKRNDPDFVTGDAARLLELPTEELLSSAFPALFRGSLESVLTEGARSFLESSPIRTIGGSLASPDEPGLSFREPRPADRQRLITNIFELFNLLRDKRDNLDALPLKSDESSGRDSVFKALEINNQTSVEQLKSRLNSIIRELDKKPVLESLTEQQRNIINAIARIYGLDPLSERQRLSFVETVRAKGEKGRILRAQDRFLESISEEAKRTAVSPLPLGLGTLFETPSPPPAVTPKTLVPTTPQPPSSRRGVRQGVTTPARQVIPSTGLASIQPPRPRVPSIGKGKAPATTPPKDIRATPLKDIANSPEQLVTLLSALNFQDTEISRRLDFGEPVPESAIEFFEVRADIGTVDQFIVDKKLGLLDLAEKQLQGLPDNEQKTVFDILKEANLITDQQSADQILQVFEIIEGLINKFKQERLRGEPQRFANFRNNVRDIKRTISAAAAQKKIKRKSKKMSSKPAKASLSPKNKVSKAHSTLGGVAYTLHKTSRSSTTNKIARFTPQASPSVFKRKKTSKTRKVSRKKTSKTRKTSRTPRKKIVSKK